MKLGRNDLCWCKSGKKYKQCHSDFDDKLQALKRKGVTIPTRNLIKTPEQIEGIREAGKINIKALDLVAENIKIGMSTNEINNMVHEFTIANNAIPAPLNYEGFPKSICTSINNVICHGIPSDNEILKAGDIINVDCTTIYNGYYADASRMFLMGDVDEKAKKLVNVTKECLDLGVQEAKPWAFLGNIGAVIGSHAIKNGYNVVKEIGGHGVGIEFHEDPYVCHVGKFGTGMVLVPGMVFTIEPMINMGTSKFNVSKTNGWTVTTKDNSLSAQWEYTLVITETGAEILAY